MSTATRRLEGKVAIVTGGASGIGACSARLFHAHGAKVVIADIQDVPGQALAAELSAAYIHCNVTDEGQVAALVDAVVTRFGRLDIMYSNAGIVPTHWLAVVAAEGRDDLARTLETNLIGGFLAAKHAARVMSPNRSGCILFTSSVSTETAGIAPHSYTVSKYGLLGLTRSLAAELGGSGIRVNCVSPFGVLTGVKKWGEVEKAGYKMVMEEVGILKGKALEVEDVAKAALYLASDEAAYVSGMNLVVDGAYSITNPTLAKVAASLM